MKLYEIDEAILACVDPETGEIIAPEQLTALQMEREKKIEGVALWYKNLISDADALKAEKQAFDEREKAARSKAESLKNWLSFATNGEAVKTSKVAISFRKSESVEVTDEKALLNYALNAERDDLLTYKEPTPNKTAIKAAIKDGVKVAGAEIVLKNNIQIK